eukprot:gnl/TRDRNA2_/TRDRNA2_137015_c0_seq2.p1 gnl/TRDRNA2_/TRDRNA2_137015_c0~~gnl/TRDRNA2_/TRDRNA2_137015_c0_seq2.p1  ORF type:complete len:120 (+),score=25.74 gnl/TRDRNA2_/TRDRNA2_137015_c0_seq2:103-462(+)
MIDNFKNPAASVALRKSIMYVAHEILMWCHKRLAEDEERCGLFDAKPADVLACAAAEFCLPVGEVVMSSSGSERQGYQNVLQIWARTRVLSPDTLTAIGQEWGMTDWIAHVKAAAQIEA